MIEIRNLISYRWFFICIKWNNKMVCQWTRWKDFSGINIKSWKNKKEPNEPTISKIIKVWKKRVIWKYLSEKKRKERKISWKLVEKRLMSIGPHLNQCLGIRGHTCRKRLEEKKTIQIQYITKLTPKIEKQKGTSSSKKISGEILVIENHAKLDIQPSRQLNHAQERICSRYK